jgi:hypothetical protein
MSAIPTIFNIYLQRNRSEGKSLSQIRPQDAVIYTTVRPKIKLVSTKESLPTANFYDAVADVSSTLRNIPDAITKIFGHSLVNSGAPLIGLTSVLYSVIGLGRTYDSFKQKRDCEKIGDITGANLARAQIVESSFLAGGSVALAVVRIFEVIQELFQLLKNPIVLSSAMVTVQTIAALISTVLYIIFYTIFVCRQVKVLSDLSDGNTLRKKLLSSPDPLTALREIIDEEMYKAAGFSEDECTEMALQEGVKWLEQLEKEVKNVPWKPTLESRRAHACELFLSKPEFMMAEMGKPRGFENMTPEGRLVRFGKFIGEKRLCAKIENDLKRQLGPEAVEVFKQANPDRAGFEKALRSANWSEWGIRWKTVLKIGLAVSCAAAIVAGTIFTGGLALGISLLVLGVAGLTWIILSDGAAFKSQWEAGEIRKRDKFLVYFSLALSVVALGVLIAFTVLSGGAPLYIAGIIFAAAWILINARADYFLIDNRRSPWKYQKQVTVQAFRKLLETKPSDEKRQKIWDKMCVEDRKGITKELLATGNIQKATEAWEKHLQDLRDENLAILIECLEESSEVVRNMPSNVVAI